MPTWTCPECRRAFGAVGRSHICRPGLTVAEFLADVPDHVPPVFTEVHDELAGLGGELVVDPLDGKVLFKHGPTVCIVGAMKKRTAVGFTLGRVLTSDRLARKVQSHGSSNWHTVNVVDADEVDDQLREWLREAYWHPVGGPPDGDGDGMVPDDVDLDW